MNPFLISKKCPMLFGCGTSMTVASKIQKLGCKKVMIVCDDWLSKQENFKAFMNTFSEVETYVWNHVIPDPTDISVEEGAVIARQENIDGIIGIGGGSSLDSAKAINTLLHSDFPINQYFAELGPDAKVPNPGVPMILIPTTSGTGADCSPSTVITNTRLNNVKNNLFVPTGIPDLAVVDPNWAMTMPPKLTASCGFDVFSHAIETISSSCWNPMSETIALKCIDIVWTYLERAYHNGSDVEAREYMHFASSAVAVAFSDSLINLGHEIAHMIGARYHIPHGDCCAMVTPACLKFLAGKLPVETGRIAKTLGVDDREDGLGDRLYDAVLAFRKRLGIMSASEHGLDKAEFMAMADDLASPVFLSYTMTADDYRSILADIISE